MRDPTVREIIEAFLALRLNDPEVMAELQRVPLPPFMGGVALGSVLEHRLVAEPLPVVADKDPLGVEEQVQRGVEALDYLIHLVEHAGPDVLPAAGRARLVERIERFLAKDVVPDPASTSRRISSGWRTGSGG